MIFSWFRQLTQTQQMITEGFKMVETAFEKLREQIEHSTTLQRSAIVLITGLADQLHEIAKHPTAAQINALADNISSHAKELAEAMARHEPGEEDEDK